MKDFLGNEIKVGDLVAAVSGNELTVTRVTKLSATRVYLEDLGEQWWKEYYFRTPDNIVSLTALGYTSVKDRDFSTDALGNAVSEGATVVANRFTGLSIGKIEKVTPKRFKVAFSFDTNTFTEIKSSGNILVIDS